MRKRRDRPQRGKVVKAVFRQFDFSTTPLALCSQWRKVRDGRLTVGKVACWRDESWVEFGDYLRYLVEACPDGIVFAFQSLSGAIVVDFQPDFAKSEVLDDGAVILLRSRTPGGATIIWAPYEKLRQGVAVNDSNAVGIRLAVAAYQE